MQKSFFKADAEFLHAQVHLVHDRTKKESCPICQLSFYFKKILI